MKKLIARHSIMPSSTSPQAAGQRLDAPTVTPPPSIPGVAMATPASIAATRTGETVVQRQETLPRRQLFRQEVLEFQQAGREWGRVLPIQPLPTRAGVWLIMLTLGASAAFAFYGSYARKAPGIGYLRPAAGTARVFVPQAGVISTVDVAQGQMVTAGQPLMTVSTGQFTPGGGEVNATMAQTLRDQIQSLRHQIAMETDHARSEQARMQAQQEGLLAELTQLGMQVRLQNERVRVTDLIVASGEKLAAKGLVSVIDQRRREDALLEVRRNLAAMLQQLQEKQGRATEARFASEQAPFAHAARIRSLQDTLAATEQKLTEVTARLAYVVRAPISGEVALLAASVGQSADPKRLQAEIVPANSPLQAELYVSAEAIGLIRAGQNVRVRYDAFPYLRYGSYQGHVLQVSHTALTEADNISIPVPIKAASYRVTVALDHTDVVSKQEHVKLQPDMLLKADVLLEKRTLADWLLNTVRIEG